MLDFVFALIALVSWSGSDLFSKMGTEQKDKYSHWRVIFFVGAIMGLHAIITLVTKNFINPNTTDSEFLLSIFYTEFKIIDFVNYLPVAFVYLLAMVIGYVGLRYIELSISSPICNASGSLALIILVILSQFNLLNEPASLNILDLIAVILLTAGIIGLGYVEYNESDEIKLMRSENTQFKYRKSFIAILIPIIYLVLDGLATVGDELLFDYEIVNDYSANTAFELTSLCFAIFAFCWVKFVRKKKMFMLNVTETDENGNVVEKVVPFSKYLIFGGICETIGQIFYMAVIVSEFEQGLPMISAYCVLSLVWARIFLKEKLSIKHYATIFITLAGILLLCLSEFLAVIGVSVLGVL